MKEKGVRSVYCVESFVDRNSVSWMELRVTVIWEWKQSVVEWFCAREFSIIEMHSILWNWYLKNKTFRKFPSLFKTIAKTIYQKYKYRINTIKLQVYPVTQVCCNYQPERYVQRFRHKRILPSILVRQLRLLIAVPKHESTAMTKPKTIRYRYRDDQDLWRMVRDRTVTVVWLKCTYKSTLNRRHLLRNENARGC